VPPLLRLKCNEYYIIWVCVGSLRYAACNVHAPYCFAICGLPGFTISFQIISQTTWFSKKGIIIKCLFWFFRQLLWGAFIIVRKNEQDKIKNAYWFSCKVQTILVRYWWDLNFLDGLPQNTQIQYLMKIHSMGAEFFRADRRTDMAKLLVAFRNFANAAENLYATCFRHWAVFYRGQKFV